MRHTSGVCVASILTALLCGCIEHAEERCGQRGCVNFEVFGIEGDDGQVISFRELDSCVLMEALACRTRGDAFS